MAGTKKNVQKKQTADSGSARKGGGSTRAKTLPPQGPKRSGTPYFVLTILVLITIILVMFNKFKEKGDFFTGDFKGVELFDKKKDKKSSDNKTKIAKEEKTEKNNQTKTDEKKDLVMEENKTIQTRIYFLKLDEKTEKLYLASVKRKVHEKNHVKNAIEHLIKGPSGYEKGLGFVSAVSGSTRVRSVSISNGNAEIDFSGGIESGAAGEILLKRVRQIVYTVTEFKDVHSVSIRINGKRRKTIGSDGLFVGGALKR